MSGVSNFLVKWMNMMTLLLSVPVLAMGIYLSSSRGSDCETFLQTPVLVIGVVMFIVSIVGCIGASNGWSVLLLIYQWMMFLLILLLTAFTIFAFVVSADGGGRKTAGTSFKQYYLVDYSSWLQDELNNPGNWRSIRSCMVDSSYCYVLSSLYPTVDKYNNASLSPTQSGCCRPPIECGYTQVNATYFNTNIASLSTNPDCRLYSNNASTYCFDCNSCKGGVAQLVKSEWLTVATVLLVVLVTMIFVYLYALCAKLNVDRDIMFQQMDAEQYKARYSPRY